MGNISNSVNNKNLKFFFFLKNFQVSFQLLEKHRGEKVILLQGRLDLSSSMLLFPLPLLPPPSTPSSSPVSPFVSPDPKSLQSNSTATISWLSCWDSWLIPSFHSCSPQQAEGSFFLLSFKLNYYTFIKNKKKCEINFNNVFSLAHYIPNIISACNQHKN